MARHMVPRYVEVVEALPKTPTEKIEKYRLRERGVTANTWDAEGLSTHRRTGINQANS
jgi:crotonobetaine/carnitine-CoA ligase